MSRGLSGVPLHRTHGRKPVRSRRFYVDEPRRIGKILLREPCGDRMEPTSLKPEESRKPGNRHGFRDCQFRRRSEGNGNRVQRNDLSDLMDGSRGILRALRYRRKRYAQPSMRVRARMEPNHRRRGREPNLLKLARHGLERVLPNGYRSSMEFGVFPFRRLYGKIYYRVRLKSFYRILEQSFRGNRNQVGHLRNTAEKRRASLLRKKLTS